MSAILTPCGDNIIQVSAWSEGDTYTHIRAGNLQQPGISCDTAADLPAQAGGLSGYYLEQDSCARVIQDNTLYCITSAGVWVLQETSPYKDVYTKSQVDSLISDIDDIIVLLDNKIDDAETEIINLINEGAKNRLNVFATASKTINGIDWTINADGTVTANGTATANSFLYLIPNNSNIAYGVSTHISGCPAGGSASTYEIQVAQTGGTTYHDYGNGETIPADYVYRYFVCCIRNGYTANNLVFSPMLCDLWKYQKTHDFVAYSPTNAELAAMIMNYHP